MFSGLNKYLLLEKKLTLGQYVIAVKKSQLELGLPDPLVDEKFKQFMKFAIDSKNGRLIDQQAIMAKKYVDTGDYEEFLRSFNLMKVHIEKWVDTVFDDLLTDYERLEGCWQALETQHHNLLDHEIFHITNMEKIRENMIACKKATFDIKMEMLKTVDLGKVLDVHQIDDLYVTQAKMCSYFLRQTDAFFSAWISIFNDPVIIELITKLFS